MKIKLLPFFLLLLQLGACSSYIHDLILGTWVDPFGQSEAVILREDGTVSWFGEEGTFEANQYKPLGDMSGPCHSVFPYSCDYFQVLDLTLPSGKKSVITPSIRACPTLSWVLHDHVSNKHVTLYLKNELHASMPEHFEKLGEGWGFPENAGCSNFEITSLDPIRASSSKSKVDGYVYNPNSDRWDWEEDKRNPTIGNDLLLVRQDLESDQWKTSLDNGSTWKAPPALVNVHMDYYSTHVTETTVVMEANGALWTLETTSDSPAWVFRKNVESMYLDYVHPTDGIIVLRTQESNPKFIVSHDYGATWQSLEGVALQQHLAPDAHCGGGYTRRPHENGFFCVGEQGNLDGGEPPGREFAIHWYNSNTYAWTTHNLNLGPFDAVVTGGDPTDGVYIRRGNQVIKWQPGGAETLITTLSGGALGRYGDIYVFDDQVIVNKFGFWRMWR